MEGKLPKLATHTSCTGCMSCRNACPYDAIDCVSDWQGFYRPEININKCIGCLKCQNSCPVITPVKKQVHNQEYYAFKNKDIIRELSSSGGVFTWLSECILKKGGIVFGAGYDGNLTVIHKSIDSVQDIDLLRGSKYVESNIGYCYREVKKYLELEQPVLFTGTPCQCEGLYAYLGALGKSPLLVTLDFICEGVPSPKIFSDLKDCFFSKYKTRIKNIYFRDKNRYFYKRPPILSRRLVFEIESKGSDSPKYIYDEYINRRYHDCMFLGAFQQEACFHCKFHSYNHITDFTCGDFHRYHLTPEFQDKLGISELMVNTLAAKELLNTNKEGIDILQCSKEDAWQPLLTQHLKKWKKYERFWGLYDRKGFEKATRMILPHIYRVKLKKGIRYLGLKIRNAIR